MGKGIERGLTDFGQQLAKRWFFRQFSPQYQRVGKEPDDVFGFG